MLDSLYLTQAEREICGRLPSGLLSGWSLRKEEQRFDDTPAHFRMRLAYLKVRDPKLLVLKDSLAKARDAAAMQRLVAEFDLQGVRQGDLAELFFALGPTNISGVMAALLKDAKTDDDVQTIAALSHIRHALLSSFLRNYR